MQNNIAKWDEHFSPRSKTLFAFFAGLYFALLQFCYFFMLEAYLSSRALSFFVALFFWLIGFLAGLNITNKSIFFRLLLVSALSYYIALLGNFLFPYKLGMLAFTGVAITLSGLAPGYFFIFQKKSFLKIKLLFFHENNGFVAGVVVCLLTVVFYGKWLLYFGPLAGLVSVWLCETKKPDPPDTQTGKYSSFMMLGVHLGIVQISAYFTIQCFVTATFFAYFALLISWMAGAIFNLKFALPKTLSHSLLLSTVAYFFLLLLVTQFPPFPGLYPVLVLLLFLLSAPAGAFFRENSSKTPPHSLFFHENNGFVIGNIVTLLAFLKWGVYFLYLGPLLSWAGWFLLRQKSPLSALLFFFSI
ncbi:MAG: hypothetical protein ACE5FU_08100, partial [Nitrospinota bacterium]